MKPENLESVYRLSPTQEGILFHSLAEPAADHYFLQIGCVLRGELEAPVFRQAWNAVIARHPALRSSFQWEELEKPVQVVSRRVELPWEEQDWRGLDIAEQERRWAALRRADRERGIELSKPPLLRLTLVRLADREHRCLWSFHHILVDGWCLPLMFREAFALYADLCRGEEPRLAPARPYRDYIAWLQKRDLTGAEAFWREYLAGLSSPTPLGIDRAPAGSTHEHEERGMELDESVTAALVALTRRRQLTLSTVLQGAWGLLLGLYSGEDDVLFGAVYSGRSAPLPGIESMVGLFINTLPVRVSIPRESQGISVGDWLQGLQERHLRLLEHESTPLVQVQGWSGIPRGLPLFESLLAFENYPVERAAQGAELALSVEMLPAVIASHYPLGLTVFEGDRLTLRVDYDSGRFDPVTAERLLGHLGRLLEQMSDPGRRLADLSPLSDAERHQVLGIWSRGESAVLPDATLQELFEAQAASTPESAAVVFGEEVWSYGELNRRANGIADRLRRLGVGLESKVGICLERSPDALAAILGVLKAGAAYVPLDPELPDERLRWIAEAVDAAALVTRQALRERIDPDSIRPAVLLDGADAEDLIRGRDADPPRLAGPGNAAYVLFTSGSTGRPKGVVVPHQAVVNTLEHARRRFAQGPPIRLAQMSALTFDASVLEIFLTLLNGGRVHLIPREVILSGEQLVWELERLQISHAFTVPAVLALLPPRDLPALRNMTVGGDRCPADAAERWAGGRNFLNVYGPTETVIYTTCYAGTRAGAQILPIGRPIANNESYLLDREGRPVPAGVTGELYLGGAGIARGYAGRPDLTAERFVPHPFTERPGERLYRTGDLARWLSDGNLDFLGRTDHQVKIRGVRVELGEVEAALERHPRVRHAAVVLRRDGSAEPRLVGYVTVDGSDGVGGDPAAPLDLRSFLAETLPAGMIPAAFVVLEEMPLSQTGKIDRRALPAPEQAGPLGGSKHVEPRDETELALAAIWSELLGVAQVGVHDNFFDLGGHSLLITRVRSRVQAAFGVDLALGELFAEPVLSGMAVAIGRAKSTGQAPEGLKLTPIPRQRHSMRRSDLGSGR